MTNLKGKLVLVTGAAMGLGRALAARLASEGARLVLTDVKAQDLAVAEKEMTAAGCDVKSYILDVTKHDSILGVRERVHADLGRVDVLVNNAGVVFGGAFLDVPYEQHALTYAVNTTGLMAMTHAFLPDLIARPEGHLVNVASASGLIGLPNGASYASSKWAVIGFSESIRLELAEFRLGHVHVTTVCPSYVATGMFGGVKTPLLTPMLDPSHLVDKVVEAVLHNQTFVLQPPIVRTLPFLKGVLPGPVFDFVAKQLGISASMKSWRGHDRS